MYFEHENGSERERESQTDKNVLWNTQNDYAHAYIFVAYIVHYEHWHISIYDDDFAPMNCANSDIKIICI